MVLFFCVNVRGLQEDKEKKENAASESAEAFFERKGDSSLAQNDSGDARNDGAKVAARDRLSQNLQKMDEPTRSAFLAQNKRIAPLFNADGTVKQEVWENMRSPQSAGRFSVEKSAKTNSQTVGNFSGITYSSSLKGRESTLKYQPVAAEQATEYAKAALRNIELVSGGRVDVVLTDGANLTTADGRQANGEYADGVVYVNANADSYERAMFIASHELTHTLEGTGEYQRLGEFIKERVAADPALAKKYDLEKYRAAYANAQAGDFSAETLEYQAATEMYADFVAKEVLGNEDVVRRLAAKQRNIAVRFLEWVRSAVRRLGGGRETQAEYKALKKAEKLLSAALENANGGVTLEEVEEDVQTAKAVKAFFEGEGDSSATRQNDSVEQKENTDEKSVGVGAQSSARYSIKNINGENIVVIDTDQDIFDGKAVSDYPKIVRQYMVNKFRGKVLSVGGGKAYINREQIEEYTFPANRRLDEAIKTAKMKAGTELDNLLKTAEFVEHRDDDGRHPKAVRGWDKYSTKFIVDGRAFEGEISLQLMERGDLFYDITKIKDITSDSRGSISPTTSQSDVVEGKPSTTIIRENSEKSTENAKKVEKTSEKSSRKSLDVEEHAKKKKKKDTLRKYLGRMEITEDTKERLRSTYGETEETKKESRYSLDLIDNYTEKQYNDYGWARVNDVLTYRENADFRAKYGEIKSGKQREVHKTASGEIIVAVNDQKQSSFGVNNVLVFAKGSYENYKITRVIRLQLDNETAIEIVRGDIYENERKQSTHKEGLFWENVYGKEFVREYTPQAFGSYQEIKAGRGRQVGGTDSGAVDGISKGSENGAGNLDGDSNNGIKRRYSLSIVDSEGRELTKEQAEYFKDGKSRSDRKVWRENSKAFVCGVGEHK